MRFPLHYVLSIMSLGSTLYLFPAMLQRSFLCGLTCVCETSSVLSISGWVSYVAIFYFSQGLCMLSDALDTFAFRLDKYILHLYLLQGTSCQLFHFHFHSTYALASSSSTASLSFQFRQHIKSISKAKPNLYFSSQPATNPRLLPPLQPASPNPLVLNGRPCSAAPCSRLPQNTTHVFLRQLFPPCSSCFAASASISCFLWICNSNETLLSRSCSFV